MGGENFVGGLIFNGDVSEIKQKRNLDHVTLTDMIGRQELEDPCRLFCLLTEADVISQLTISCKNLYLSSCF